MTIPSDLRNKTVHDVEIIDSKIAYQGFFNITQYHAKYRLFAGGWSQVVQREVFTRRNAVAVLLYDPKRDEVVMIEQFRMGAIKDKKSPWLLEVVAGFMDTDESEEEVAKREAMEEAGLKIQKLIRILTYWPSPGGSAEQTTVFCGIVDSINAGGIHGLEREHEDIKVHVFSRKEAMELLKNGDINNACSIIALQWLELNLHQIKKIKNVRD